MPFDTLDDAGAHHRIRSSSSMLPGLAAAVALVLGLLLTLWLAQGERLRAHESHRTAFLAAAGGISQAVRTQLADCERLIRTFQSLYLASEEVTQAEFNSVFDNLQADRARISLQALAFAQKVGDGPGARFITTVYAPQLGNEAILGLNVAEQPPNLRSLYAAGDSNELTMSAPFRLRQSGPGGTALDGFILRLPVYGLPSAPPAGPGRRGALVGSIGASFRIQTLLNAALPSDRLLLATVVVDDVTEPAPRRLATYRMAPAGAGIRHVEEIVFGGRTWRISTVGAGGPVYRAWTATTPWLGALGSALLAALVWSLLRTRERAIRLGTAMSERFRASEERFRKLTELLPSLVMVARRDDGRVVYQNATARARLGAGTVGRRLDKLFEPAPLEELLAGEGGARTGDIEVHPEGGGSFWASAATSSIVIDGQPMWLLVANDVSEQRRLTERLSYQATHDSLTKLLNRREFEARISEALLAQGGPSGALLFVDLDQFKLINDTSGHRAGDELLVQLAAVMREKLRPGDVLGRLGGDEFGVLLGGLSTRDAAAAAAERLRRTVEAFSFSWEQRTYTTSASIGAVMLSGADSLKELFSRADAACYLAKEEGRNRVHFYSENDDAVTTRLGEMEWASRLRNAIHDGRLRLDYQELHPLREGASEPPHVELLLRLQAEDGREVMPGAFLPAAERYGLMPAIDRWVVETALRNLDRLHPSGAGLATCAINLSAASLEDGGLVQFIEDLVRACHVDPTRLLFEITETVAMRDFAASSALIARLRALGCRVALDDFGAGMSSFGYMKNLELDMVKIDGSFVQELASDRMSQSIVRAVTEIGHQQGLKVVAEWVSCPEMVGLLRGMGVDYAQGYALHSPERVMFQRSDPG